MSGRVFQTLREATLEIRRDLSKGTKVDYSRVQQHTGMVIPGRELQAYTYTVMDGGMPETAGDLVEFGIEHGFKPYIDHASAMETWLIQELNARRYPLSTLGHTPTELINPLLAGTIEGNHPSYTYQERMVGAIGSIVAALQASPDSRRAFWPIYRVEDAYRAAMPTRVPCSLGYDMMIRNVNGLPRLQVFYLERACDFDRFWLSDIWFAYRLGKEVASYLDIPVGTVSHFILSFHSFAVELSEVY